MRGRATSRILKNSGPAVTLQSEINVAPLVDVVLVLLIIFMVIVPLTLRGYDVDVPGEAVAATPTESSEQVTLRIEAADCPLGAVPESDGLPAGCRVRLGDELVPAADLARRAGEVFATRATPERVLFITVEPALNYEGVMRIVDAAKSGVDGLRIGMMAGG
jgi:biopolymer transport protein ExbD